MAHMQYLIFNGENIPKPVSYDISSYYIVIAILYLFYRFGYAV